MRKMTGVLFPALLTTALLSVGCGSDSNPTNPNGVAGAPTTTKKIDLGPEVHIVAGSDAKNADGTAAHPFATVNAASSAIDLDTGWVGAVIIHEGRYEVLSTVTLPIGATLQVEAGTTMALAELVAFNVQGDITMVGTEAKPITMTWLTEGKHWGSMTNYEPSSQNNVFKYVIFEHGFNTNFKEIYERGALSLNQSKALISYCIFRNNDGDDGLTLVNSSSIIEYSQFLNNVADAIDQGPGYAEIRFTYFEGNGNDGADLGDGSTAWVHDNVMYKNGDKGVSVGEGCIEPRVEHNLCVENAYGMAVKDGSTPIMSNNTLYANKIGFGSYESVGGMGSGKGSFTGGIIWGSTQAEFNVSSDSQTAITYTCIGNPVNEDGTTPTTLGVGVTSPGKGCDDPLFADPANLDFHLKSVTGRWLSTVGSKAAFNIATNADLTSTWVTDAVSSPGIDTGDPAASFANEPAPNGSRVNLGTYGNSVQASKSP